VRSMAKAVGVSKDTVQRVWKDNGLQPHRTKSFKPVFYSWRPSRQRELLFLS